MMLMKALAPARARLLLDLYPGATFAVGLRKLRRTYKGACIRVRRASDNTEQDIGFVGDLLDTNALSTFCSGTEGYIRTWYDQSVNENEAGISTTSLQPQIYASGAILADGALFSADYLQLTNVSDLAITGTTARTIFGVFKRANNFFRMIFAARPSTYQTAEVYLLTSEYGVRVQGGNELYTSSAPASLELLTLTLTGTNVTDHNLRIDGSAVSAVSSVSLTLNTTITVAYLGDDPVFLPASPYSGNISEFIIYDSDQTSNHAGIESNINNHYNAY